MPGPDPRHDRWARWTCATGPPDVGGNHPREGDDEPKTARTESESHPEQKGRRGNGHSFWAYWAPYLLAAVALLLGIPVYLAQRRHMSQPEPVPPYR